MTMYNGYTYDVRTISPSGLLKYTGGRASTTRQFMVNCINAEDFALRQIGKFYDEGNFETPVLPAPFPFDYLSGGPRTYGRLNMVAKDFEIEPVCTSCFNSENGRGSDLIGDPVDIDTMEKYFYQEGLEGYDNSECFCRVLIRYEENPCDCTTYDTVLGEWNTHADILAGTCISVERNPSYEMFTLPTANLVWSDLPDGPDRQIKTDTPAYQVIPKADIIVNWHNVPVRFLCLIEAHLTPFRNTVNHESWGAVLICGSGGSASEEQEFCTSEYEAETILFIDWEEDRERRTDAFGGLNNDIEMNTTTLRLHFKQKRVVDQFTDDVVGWNHNLLDRSDDDPGNAIWQRVKVDKGDGNEENVFPLKDFTNILEPSI